jgi:hypothetical protein
MLYCLKVRRHYIWYGLGAGWGIAAAVGLLRHHAAQAVPAAVFAVLFIAAGVWIGRRDEAMRNRRSKVKLSS